METNFNFKSAICTSRSQSERLLALGLKKETRDAVLKKYIHNDKYCYKPVFEDIEDRLIDCNDLYPAWSMHRLMCMLPRYVRKEHTYYGRKYIAALDLTMDEDLCIGYKEGVDEPCDNKIFYANNIYNSLCDCIEWLIKEGYFNKEYLNGTTEN